MLQKNEGVELCKTLSIALDQLQFNTLTTLLLQMKYKYLPEIYVFIHHQRKEKQLN